MATNRKSEKKARNKKWRNRPEYSKFHKEIPEYWAKKIAAKHPHRRVSNYADFVYTSMWSKEKERLIKLQKEFNAVNIFVKKDMKSSMELMVNIVGIATKFYDEGLIKVSPGSLAWAVEDFNANLSTLSCRKKMPHGFWNQAPKGETVTLDNLYLGVCDRILPKDAKKYPKPLIVEYNGEFFLPLVTQKPLRDWINKKQKSLIGKNTLEFNSEHFIQETIRVKSIIQRNIDFILSTEAN